MQGCKVRKLILSVCLFWSWAAAFAAAAGPIPAIDFVRKPTYESAKISPNGDYLAVGLWVENSLAVGVIDIKKLKLTGVLRFTPGEHALQYWWVGPDRIVASV